MRQIQCSKMYVNMEEADLTDLYFNGFIEPVATELFRSLVRDSRVIVDIGANIGYYSLLASKTNPKATVYAFEPKKTAFNLLRKNIELNNYGNIKAYRLAVSDTNGFVDLWTNGDSCLSSLQRENNVSKSTLTRERVESVRLDDFLKETPDLIKIDTQGSEGLILSGATRILSGDVKILMEFCPQWIRNTSIDSAKLLGMLRGCGFQIHVINHLTNPANIREYNIYLTKNGLT